MTEPLDDYRRKRDFERTPEPPPGEGGAGGSSFVVQKHDATRLHYDFRLEVEGVLKSWAVPKGPSLDPGVKRLAVPTEDHPLSYGTFEGTIPKGQYGGGAVLVWDRGTFEPKGDPAEALAKGRLSFVLHGEKLHGGFSLVRLRDQEQWLLIKKDDEHADRGRDIVSERPESVLGTGPLGPAAAETELLPTIMGPMLCQLYESAPDGDEWIHELKLDGYRMLCRFDGDQARFFSRNGHEWTDKVGANVRDAVAGLGRRGWLDGELVAFDAEGRTRFRAVRSAVNAGDPSGVTYMAFDLLFLDGVDLRSRSLLWRKAQLRRLLEEGSAAGSPVRLVEHVRGEGPAFYAHACALGVEGVVSKRADSLYQAKRSPSWRKLRCTRKDELLVAGYLPSKARDDRVGSLILATRDGAGLTYAGRVGTGFTDDQRVELKRTLDAEVLAEPMVAAMPPIPDKTPVWVRPRWVAEVTFTEWTAAGRLRHPSFVALREDKGPEEVRREQAPDAHSERAPRRRRRGPTRSLQSKVKLTNPTKVLYPDAGLTKRDLFDYVASVAETLLPHVAARPLTVVRCPDGIGGQCFFQKHAMAGLPAAVSTTLIPEKKGKGEYLYVTTAEGLLALTQLGSLELHIWGSRIDRPDRPDRMVFDLDPAEGLGWDDVVRAAREVRDVLDTLGLESFVMTTGGKGVHVVVALERRYDFGEVKRFSGALAKTLADHAPRRYIAKATKAAREGKIFIDYLRNGRGATAVAPYSMRAREGAPVAVPIRWDEIAGLRGGDHYRTSDVLRRLDGAKSDPWEGLAPQRLTKKAQRALGIDV